MAYSRQSLDQEVRKLRAKIQEFREKTPALNEAMTKFAFINPLLAELGWNLEDPDEVGVEYKSKPKYNPVDYALFIQKSPRLFIEAKALKADLSDTKWITQIISYAAVSGVEWCVLTNGDEYRLYNTHATVDIDQKLYRAIKLSDEESQSEAVETLSLLSKESIKQKSINILYEAHFVDQQVKKTIDGMVLGHDDSLVRLIGKRTEGLTAKDIRESLARIEMKIELPKSLPHKEPKHPREPESSAKAARRKRRKGGDTIVVPAREDGFDQVFLGENRWYAVKIKKAKVPEIKYIAAYRVKPVSAITHYAEVSRIERYEDTDKSVIYFKDKARPIGPIGNPKGHPFQGLRYASFAPLSEAKTIDDLWPSS